MAQGIRIAPATLSIGLLATFMLSTAEAGISITSPAAGPIGNNQTITVKGSSNPVPYEIQVYIIEIDPVTKTDLGDKISKETITGSKHVDRVLFDILPVGQN